MPFSHNCAMAHVFATTPFYPTYTSRSTNEAQEEPIGEDRSPPEESSSPTTTDGSELATTVMTPPTSSEYCAEEPYLS
ncbi:hypothetical protein EVAR_72440_1 [Eumeta japonica]|uniref:Uncharacterized protein n=1 Tax=Eumeta variegata TaxID=151549 RepID=A0A4C1SZG5_EUMVA|nr:hypothetical protein EVAR_72440_1 [Eumeta japonica]